MLMSCFSMQDSGLFPLGRVPEPSCQEAFGKLKSPDRIMSGTGVLRLAIVLLILSIIMFLKESSRGLPWYLLWGP